MLKTFLPTVNVPGKGKITVSRNVGSPPPLPTMSDITSILSENTYPLFTTQPEYSHNNVHGWGDRQSNVGYTIFSYRSSLLDAPYFLLAHACLLETEV